jgi:TonB family protein
MRLILFLFFYSAFMASAFSADAIIDDSISDCSGISTQKIAPHYPAQALRDKKGGEVIVAIWIDKCGRAVKSEVFKSSGNKLLNSAALEAASKSVFNRANDLDQELSRIEVPYKFTSDKKEYKSEKVLWPASHKKAYFVLDETPMQFETVQEAKAKIGSEPYRLISWRPVQQMMQINNEDGDIWLFLADNVTYKYKVAARYHRISAEKPTVNVQVLCDPAILDCGKMKATLLKSGLLPFAKSLNE